MRAPIAKIKISAGNPGWYDPLTNTHLTITRPEAIIYEGSNLSNIKIGISHKLIHVIEGDLEPIIVSDPIKDVKKVREVIEEPKVEEVIEKTTTKKNSTKKKAAKKSEEKTK